MKTLKELQSLDLGKVAKAIEADAGKALPGLRGALAEAKAGKFGATHTPEAITARKRGRPAGSVKQDAKISTTLRLDPEVIEAFKAQGAGWQTRINDLLLSDIQAGRHLANS